MHIFAFNSTIQAIKECSNQINPQNKKGSYTSYLHFIEKAQQNPSKHSCATAIFVCGHKKMCMHGQSNKTSKQKRVIHFLSTFHRKVSTKSKQAFMRYSRFCVWTYKKNCMHSHLSY